MKNLHPNQITDPKPVGQIYPNFGYCCTLALLHSAVPNELKTIAAVTSLRHFQQKSTKIIVTSNIIHAK